MSKFAAIFNHIKTYPLKRLVPEVPSEDELCVSSDEDDFGPITYIVYDHFKWIIEIKAGEKLIARNTTLVQITYNTNGDTFLHDIDHNTVYPDVDMDEAAPITWSSAITNIDKDTITISTLDAIGEYAQLYPDAKPQHFTAIRNTLEALST